MNLFAYTIIAGIMYGIFFGLVGLGLNIIFGVLKMINLAHGDIIMLGSFLAYWLYHLLGLNPLWAVPVAVAVFFIVGYPLYYAFVPRLLKSKDPEMLSFILFFGVSQVIEAVVIFSFGNNQRSIPGNVFGAAGVDIFGQRFPISWLITTLVALAAFGFVYWFLRYTRPGYATRAVMANRDEAMMSGIDVNRVSAVVFCMGLALAAIAGVFSFFVIGASSPSMGPELTTVSFAIIVLGSLGNPLGTILGGLIYGIAIMFMQSYFSSWADILPYVLLIAVMLFKPEGLVGKAARGA
ncbi:MAG: branched-chain amino acid ABC transporter permease [Syntrophobacteraceae bacterium]|nr:branched-chain amino acid ABC transporter permease [Syntrophobacteraceae bacterium]